MALRIVRQLGDEILKKKSKKIKAVDEKIKTLVNDMIETMEHFGGCGIAAVQVGILKDVIVCKPDEKAKPIVYVNPELIDKSDEKEIDYEGCLSVDGKRGKVERSKDVHIKALNIDGEAIDVKATGFLSRVIQHELDHLEGVLYTEKLKSVLEDTSSS